MQGVLAVRNVMIMRIAIAACIAWLVRSDSVPSQVVAFPDAGRSNVIGSPLRRSRMNPDQSQFKTIRTGIRIDDVHGQFGTGEWASGEGMTRVDHYLNAGIVVTSVAGNVVSVGNLHP